MNSEYLPLLFQVVFLFFSISSLKTRKHVEEKTKIAVDPHNQNPLDVNVSIFTHCKDLFCAALSPKPCSKTGAEF